MKRFIDEKDAKPKKKQKLQLELYSDLLQNIFPYLTAAEICKCSLVSREWYSASQTDFVWKQVFFSRFSDHLPPNLMHNNGTIQWKMQYKNTLVKMFSTELPISDVPSPIDSEIWKTLTIHQKMEKCREYSELFDKSFKEMEYLKSYEHLLRVINIVQRLIEQSDEEEGDNKSNWNEYLSWKIYLIDFNMMRGVVLRNCGFSFIAKEIYEQVLDDIDELSRDYEIPIPLTDFLSKSYINTCINLGIVLNTFLLHEQALAILSCSVDFARELLVDDTITHSGDKMMEIISIFINCIYNRVYTLRKLKIWKRVASDLLKLTKLYLLVEDIKQKIEIKRQSSKIFEEIKYIFQSFCAHIKKWPRREFDQFIVELSKLDKEGYFEKVLNSMIK